MGYLTTITIHNDALHAFEEDPKAFAEAIFKGIEEANRNRKESDVTYKNYGGYITVQPSRHADDETVYLHTGNTVFNMNPWCDDFKHLAKRNPELVERWVDKVKDFAKWGNEYLQRKGMFKNIP